MPEWISWVLAKVGLRRIAGAASTANRLELYEKLDGYRDRLDALLAERDALRERVRQIESESGQKQHIRFDCNAVWSGDGTDRSHGPYCMTFYGRDGKLVAMIVAPAGSRGVTSARCGHCKTSVWLQNASDRHANPARIIRSSLRPGWVDGYR